VLIEDADLALPLGLEPQGRHAFETCVEADGPIGVYDNFGPGQVVPVFTATIDGEAVLSGTMHGNNRVLHNIVEAALQKMRLPRVAVVLSMEIAEKLCRRAEFLPAPEGRSQPTPPRSIG
jgi:hypothetical protein